MILKYLQINLLLTSEKNVTIKPMQNTGQDRTFITQKQTSQF